MTSTTKQAPKSRKQPERHLRISKPVNGNYALAMTIGEGEKAKRFCYFLEPIAADFGLGFRFEKFIQDQVEGEPSEYAVNIDLQHGHHSCECRGFQRWHHCKHVEALVSLIRCGKIAAQTQSKPVVTNAEEPIAAVLLGGERHRQEMAQRQVNPVCFNCGLPYEQCQCCI